MLYHPPTPSWAASMVPIQAYELDYWCTSLREITAAQPFAREDIKISDSNIFGEDPDYAIACRYKIWDPEFYPEFKTVATITRGDGILSIIKARE
jgi:hypothetical protein